MRRPPWGTNRPGDTLIRGAGSLRPALAPESSGAGCTAQSSDPLLTPFLHGLLSADISYPPTRLWSRRPFSGRSLWRAGSKVYSRSLGRQGCCLINDSGYYLMSGRYAQSLTNLISVHCHTPSRPQAVLSSCYDRETEVQRHELHRGIQPRWGSPRRLG